MKRKILVTLLAFCLIASLCVVGAAARSAPAAVEGAECTDPATCDHEAAIGGLHYDTLELAIASAEDGDTVELLGNIEDGSGVVVDGTAERNIVIDFNGYTYTVVGGPAGSTGTESQCFQLLKGSTITMRDGAIVAGSEKMKMIIQNYCNLTLEDMTLDATKGTNKVSYVLSNNCGNVVITGNTNITANNGFAFDAYYWPSNTYTEGVTVTIDKNFTGTITGDIEATRDTSTTSTGNSTINIEAGTVNGDITCASNGKVSISNATVNGDITNTSTVGGELVIDDAQINGTVANSGTSATTTVTGSFVTGEVTGAVVIDSTVAGIPTNTAPDGVVAVIGAKQFASLQDAIDSITTSDPTTIILVANADMGSINKTISDKDITIVGNGYPVIATVGTSGGETAIGISLSNTKLTLDNVDMTVNGTEWTANNSNAGQAFDVKNNGSALNIVNDSHLTLQNLQTAFVLSGKVTDRGEIGEINIEDSAVTITNIDGNASNGGDWTVSGSTISYTNIGSHALSVETADVENSTITVNGAGRCAIYGKELNFGENTIVNVSNSGPDEPKLNWDKSDTYYGAIQVKLPVGDGVMTVADSAVISVSGENNTIYFPENAELINNGTINATVTVPEDSDMYVVVFMADGAQYDVQVVDSGDSVRMPTLSKSGYTFTGWRVNNSNTIVRGGESYKITANTTFTAVWNMIMIPDTYDIAVDQPAHGTVDVSFSNASQGSVITVTATPDEGYELVYITVDGEPISGNSFVMPDHAVEVSAVFAEIGKEVNFVDVSRADWFYDYVQYVAQNGLMEGTTRTAFEPNASMTRAMFWTVLARIDGETITGDAWKTLAQTWAVESGISDGTNADALITREQMVTMLYRYAGSPVTGGMAISEFTDGSSVSDYAADAVTWALSEGILTGMGDGILAPQGTATRAQAAAMLMRFVEA